MIEEVKKIFYDNFKEKILNVKQIDGGWLTEKYRIISEKEIWVCDTGLSSVY